MWRRGPTWGLLMRTKVVIHLIVNSAKSNPKMVQWIAVEVRDYALEVVGVAEAHIAKVEEVDEYEEG